MKYPNLTFLRTHKKASSLTIHRQFLFLGKEKKNFLTFFNTILISSLTMAIRNMKKLQIPQSLTFPSGNIEK